MEFLNIILTQVLSPPILFFALGMFAVLAGSDLKIPDAMSTAMLLFLLVAIGLEGGVGIAKVGIGAILAPAFAAIILGVGIVVVVYFLLIKMKFDISNAGGIAGHYGAVNAATMVAGLAFLDDRGVSYETFIPALYPLMDSPAILTAILLARFGLAKTKADGSMKVEPLKLLKEGLLGKAVLLLIASMLIGFVTGSKGTKPIMPFFHDMVVGVLCLFLLDMGIVAAGRLKEWKVVGGRLLAFAIIMPPIYGIVGVFLGALAGLSVGGATILGAISGSASFISAPAAMRAALPEANPSLSLTAAVALTFPFSIIIGIPLYYAAAQLIIT
jgi:hypothetical protein